MITRFSNFSLFWVSGSPRNAAKNSCQKLKELQKSFKTISGSHSGLDASIQAKKQALKSHATVPFKGIAGKVRVQGTGDIGQETTDTDIDTVR